MSLIKIRKIIVFALLLLLILFSVNFISCSSDYYQGSYDNTDANSKGMYDKSRYGSAYFQ